MARSVLRCIILVLTAAVISSAPAEDRVLHLPGLDSQPDYDHYAGYLRASDSHFFYWFVPSERNATHDPLVLWLNGGPGCSSLFGILGEVGPWKTTPGGIGLTWSEHRWNKIANMIFLESPQCVGYSYSNDGSCSADDEQVARDNHLALKDFFVKFPEYRNNEFYMTGESYAGIYVPTLASLLEDDPEINFKGFSLGNSVTDFVTIRTGFPYFAYARGLLGTDMWNSLLEHCCVDRNAPNCISNIDNVQCQKLLDKSYRTKWYSGLNPYNMYADCYGGVPDSRGVIQETENGVKVTARELIMPTDTRTQNDFKQFVKRSAGKKQVVTGYPCTDTTDLDSYFNRDDVRAALHVSENADEWLACRYIPYDLEGMWEKNVRAEYYKVLQRGHRIVAYFGDVDMVCDHLSGMWFVESLGIERLEPLKRWFYEDQAGYNQIAGFVIQYDGLKFVSIKGAGHSVPVDKPLQAYMLFEKFLNDEPY